MGPSDFSLHPPQLSSMYDTCEQVSISIIFISGKSLHSNNIRHKSYSTQTLCVARTQKSQQESKIIVTLGPQLSTGREEKSSMTPQAGGQLCKGEHLSSSSISIAIGCTTASRVYNKVSGKYPHWFHSPANDNGFYTYKTHRWKDYLSAMRAYPWPLGCSRRRL